MFKLDRWSWIALRGRATNLISSRQSLNVTDVLLNR